MKRLARNAPLVALATVVALALGACSTTQSTLDQADDSAITAAVKSRLARDPEVKAYAIDVDTLAGEVTLTGKVGSQQLRAEAVRLARNTSGVRGVRDNLTVGESPTMGDRVDDAAITARVKAKLVTDELVKARDIDVDTVQGVVTLTGRVRSSTERSRAQRLARETEGVAEVRNLIEVIG